MATIATWGLFQRSALWETAAAVSAVVGVIALVPYWIAAHQAGEVHAWSTALIIALGGAGVADPAPRAAARALGELPRHVGRLTGAHAGQAGQAGQTARSQMPRSAARAAASTARTSAS